MIGRSAVAVSRRMMAVRKPTPASLRMFTPSMAQYSSSHDSHDKKPKELTSKLVPFEEIKSMDDLLPPGADPGTVPTDYEQATGLERFELLGKMNGIDVFDMKPLDSSRKGTLDNPILLKSAGDEQYAGCRGFPRGSHWVRWLTLSRKRPMARCNQCGNVYMMEYVGPPDDAHGHDEHHDEHHEPYEEPKNFADYVRPEYKQTPPGFKNSHLL